MSVSVENLKVNEQVIATVTNQMASLKLDYTPRILIGISSRHDVPTVFALQLMKLRELYKEWLEDIIFDYIQPVDVSRNNLFVKFLVDYPYASHILILDTDVMVPYDLLPRLLSGEKNSERPFYITGGLVVRKMPPFYPLMNVRHGPGVYRPIISWPPDAEWQPVDSMGFGAVLVHKKVLQDIPFPFAQTSATGSEDYYFFEKCAIYGYKAAVNLKTPCAHIGPYFYTIEESKKFLPLQQRITVQSTDFSPFDEQVNAERNKNAADSQKT